MTSHGISREAVEIHDGQLTLFRNVLPVSVADQFVNHLRTLNWQHEIYRGKATRRGTAWYADAGVEYRYSGQSMIATGWDSEVDGVRQTIEKLCDCHFNSVLLNHYPDGRAQMGWHSDDEPELGPNPVIASLSFGAERAFKLRHKQTHEKRDCVLEDNSLLLMSGELQHHWQHTLPRRSANVGERFNLTFRYTIPDYWSGQS